MSSKLIKERIEKEEDFIFCPRLNNSLKKLILKNPDGVEDERICKVLMISQDELNEIYESALNKFRSILEVKEK